MLRAKMIGHRFKTRICLMPEKFITRMWNPHIEQCRAHLCPGCPRPGYFPIDRTDFVYDLNNSKWVVIQNWRRERERPECGRGSTRRCFSLLFFFSLWKERSPPPGGEEEGGLKSHWIKPLGFEKLKNGIYCWPTSPYNRYGRLCDATCPFSRDVPAGTSLDRKKLKKENKIGWLLIAFFFSKLHTQR